jgi:DNA replication protein DnaC
METVQNILQKVVEDLGQPTKENPRNTRAWAKFQDFRTLNDPQLEHMKDEAVSFIDDLFNNRTPRWLSLLGTSGAGKTMLAKRISKLFATYRHQEIDWLRTKQTQSEASPYGEIIRWRGGYINWGKAINRMLQGDYDFLHDLRNYDFFALDDIVSEYQKLRELSASKLYDVLESRLGKWTVITANLGLEAIGNVLDPRIASRMIRNNSIVVDVDVPDWNLRAE